MSWILPFSLLAKIRYPQGKLRFGSQKVWRECWQTLLTNPDTSSIPEYFIFIYFSSLLCIYTEISIWRECWQTLLTNPDTSNIPECFIFIYFSKLLCIYTEISMWKCKNWFFWTGVSWFFHQTVHWWIWNKNVLTFLTRVSYMYCIRSYQELSISPYSCLFWVLHVAANVL